MNMDEGKHDKWQEISRLMRKAFVVLLLDIFGSFGLFKLYGGGRTYNLIAGD